MTKVNIWLVAIGTFIVNGVKWWNALQLSVLCSILRALRVVFIWADVNVCINGPVDIVRAAAQISDGGL